MADKRIDAAKLTAPLPAWRWLVWFRPIFNNPPAEGHPVYLVGGSDDLAEARTKAAENPGYYIAENPVWRTLN